MCIRDRLAHIAAVEQDLALVDAARLGNQGQNREQHRALACLLYTSDAADERSSVDLGGRRIIKKKNTSGRQTADTCVLESTPATHNSAATP